MEKTKLNCIRKIDARSCITNWETEFIIKPRILFVSNMNNSNHYDHKKIIAKKNIFSEPHNRDEWKIEIELTLGG